MNKKSMAKTGMMLIVLATIILLIIMPLFSSALVEETYILGEKIRINLRGYGTYKMKIETPTDSLIKQGINNVVLFTPSEVGNYSIKLQYGRDTEYYIFEVLGERVEEINEAESNGINQTANETFLNDLMTEREVIIGQPVKWIKKGNVALGTRRTKLAIPLDGEDISVYSIGQERKEVNFDVIVEEAKGQKSVILSGVYGDIEVEYYTEGPKKQEKKIGRKKEVTIYYDDVYNIENIAAYSDIEEISKIYKGINVYWVEENKYINFETFDLDGDGFIDRIMWIIPHLSNQTFEIIVISQAEHLDAGRDFIEDVYPEVSAQDGIWKNIPDGNYLRVVFEKNLTDKNDITLYARGNGKLQVYEKDETDLLMEFNISGERWYKEYLVNLAGSQDTFDLLVTGNVDFDLVIDPTTGGTTSGGLRPQSVTCYNDAGTESCDGSYPGDCAAAGDRLSCDDGQQELQATEDGLYGGVLATYYDTSVTDCVLITHIDICYEWRTTRDDPTDCEISIDNDNPDTFVEVVSSCPGTAGASGCYDATSSETDWVCGNFFGASGERAEARAYMTSPNQRSSNTEVDQLWYNVTYQKAGFINGTLNEPSTIELANNETIYETFLVNASVECEGDAGDGCGVVTGYLMYNGSAVEPDTFVSSTPGVQPFFADAGSQSCGDMNATIGQDYCELTWAVNATQLGNWKIDVNFSSAYSVVYDNNTKNANISVYNAPTLTVNLSSPVGSFTINETDSFELNCTANCSGQACLDVEVNATFCSGGGCTPLNLLTTVSSGLSSDINSVSLGVVVPNSIETGSFNVSGDSSGEYVLSCNVSSSNAGDDSSFTTFALTVNELPVASFEYPSASEWLHATETLNGSASTDSDGSIVNYKFEIDDNVGFASPLTICDGASEDCDLNTSSQVQCGQETSTCYLRLEVIDDDGGRNLTIIPIGIDNVAPSLDLDNPHNSSYISSENYLVNASAADSGSGMGCVEFSFFNGTWNLMNLDCGNPYEHNWDLSAIDDQILGVRARANDSEGNWGGYDNHTNITHDTTLPIAILDSPVDDEIINETTYLLNASSSYNGLAGMKNASFYYENSTDFGLIWEDTDASDGLTYSWGVDIGDGVYNISVNVTDNAGHINSTYNENITIDIVDNAPICVVSYPNGDENVSGIIVINATASEADPADYVVNLSFEYSIGGGWTLIEYNLTSDLDYYTLSWDTTGDSDGTTYRIRCNLTDSRNSVGTDSSNADFRVDNTAPDVTEPYRNSTYVEVNTYMCFNVTVADDIVGVERVWAEVDFPLGVGGGENLTLYDAGGNCDETSGDNIYSNRYLVEFDGEYNWSYAYSNDTLGNLNKSLTSLNWSGYSNSYLIAGMLAPTSNIEVNESGEGSFYDQTCNITCNQSGGACNDVHIFPQYYSGGWIDIVTFGDSLFNEVNNYSCGTLGSGVECNYTFNISANYSGGNTFQIRCRGSSSNAAADFSSTVDLHVNNFPVAAFTYPSASEWLHATETLNGSASTDSDGSTVNYKFEIDDDVGFASPLTICDGASEDCDLNTSSQTQCSQETSTCYLRLEVRDDDGTTNFTIIQVGIDNIAPGVELNMPYNYTNITTEIYLVNGSASDSGSGVDCIEFSAYYNGGWNVINFDCSDPYEYNWDLSSIGDQIMELRARANDSEGNLGSYDGHENITHDTTLPSINLDYPSNNSYVNDSSLTFNFTGEDSVAEILECSLILNEDINQTNSSVLNGTITEFIIEQIVDGEYNWSINCTDHRSGENSSEIRGVIIDTVFPVINLDYPGNNSWLNTSNVEFNYTPIDDNLDSCELWGNWTGWHLNDTDTGVINNDVNSFNKDLQDETYYWNIKCNDSAGNFAFNSSNFTFNIDTIFPQIYFNPSTTQENYTALNWIFVNVTASDLKKDFVRLGWQTGNETFDFNEGNSYWKNKTGLSEGIYTFYAWINDSSGNYNQTSTRTIVVDLTAPNYSQQNQIIYGEAINIVHGDEIINLSALWGDNVNLSYAWLSTNESGAWENQSAISLSGIEGVSEFSWINSSVSPGEVVSWIIYANDSVGNFNFTDYMSFAIWGWSEVDLSYLSPSGVKQGELTTMYCEIQDNVSEVGIQGYEVSFYNNSFLMGTNITGADGFAEYTLNITEAGSYTIACNISDNSSLYYNASANYEGSGFLGVGFGESVYDYTNLTYHRAYEGTTDTTTTQVGDYPALQYNDASNENFITAGVVGLYAYQRFEMKIDEKINEVTQMNISWIGYGDVSSGTDGFILYVYNFTSQTWVQMFSYSTDNTQQTANIGFTEGFNDTINSTGWVWVLARSFSAAPSPNPKTAKVSTNYIELRVRKDIIPPTVTLVIPENYYNFSSQEVIFNCSVEDDKNINNVTLYGTWLGGWHANETDESKLNNINYTFNKSIEEGTFLWNCYACDKADNCDYAPLNYTFTIDLTGPDVSLLYPGNYDNFSYFTIEQFNFSVEDNISIENCSLWGNWTGSWHLNQTILNPIKDTELNFSSANVSADGYYIWNVECFDIVGNPAFNLTNFTFSAFLFPENVSYVNSTQTKNDGTGDITLFWEESNHTINYSVYYASSLSGAFVLLNTTSETNYTDTTFAGTRRFYRVDSWNPSGQNASEDYFGLHVYTLRHNTNSKNWIGFPTDFVNLDTANQTLSEIRNATAFAMWNATDQKKVSCTEFLCPNGIECTNEACNFNLEQGRGYEVFIDTGEPSPVQWSGVGIVYEATSVPLEVNSSDFAKNWIAMYADTSLTNAQDLIQDIPNADAVTQWDSSVQTTKGLIPSFLQPGEFIGQNFNINIEEGYETSVTSSGSWSQS